MDQVIQSAGVAIRRSVRVAETDIGKGVFAERPFPVNSVIGSITGEVIDDPNYTSDYCIELNDTLSLEPAAPFRFLNHSCEPNCEFDFDAVDATSRDGLLEAPVVLLYAIRDIQPDEQLTIDYNWPASHAIPCECGSVACRGWVVSEDEMFD